MPAGVRGRRAVNAVPKVKGGARRPRGRARAGVAGPSKLQAARSLGLPGAAGDALAGLLLAIGLTVALATGGRGEAIVGGIKDAVASRFAVLGFRLQNVHLQGASPAAQAEIVAAVDLKPGIPIFAIDLDALRARVERVSWVEHARVIRLLPDTLVIAVDQRPLVALWQHGGKTEVIAADGSPVARADPGAFPKLPLVVGEGANTAAAATLVLIARRHRLARRVKALVRVDERRWDADLDDGEVIALPTGDPGAGLARLDALDRADKVLDLKLARIDLRDPAMIVVRPLPGPGQPSPVQGKPA